jgi:hypothetical protein
LGKQTGKQTQGVGIDTLPKKKIFNFDFALDDEALRTRMRLYSQSVLAACMQ